MKIRRYAIKGWLSYDVQEGEDPKEILAQIERAFDNGMGSTLGPAVYFGVDDSEGPSLEDTYDRQED